MNKVVAFILFVMGVFLAFGAARMIEIGYDGDAAAIGTFAVFCVAASVLVATTERELF